MITERKQWLVWATFPRRDQLIWRWNWVYMQCDHKRWLPFFVRQVFYTKAINLSQTKEQLLQTMSAKSRYKVRRARKDSLTIQYHLDYQVIIDLFSMTAEAKGLNTINEATFRTKSSYLISEVRSGEHGVLAAHFYQLDKERSKVHLTYNCSAYRLHEDKAIRSLCGRANRLLFLEDIYYFKDEGFSTFDYGGYGAGAEKADQEGVNAFKDTLPGEIGKQYNYYPLWYWVWRGLRYYFRKK